MPPKPAGTLTRAGFVLLAAAVGSTAGCGRGESRAETPRAYSRAHARLLALPPRLPATDGAWRLSGQPCDAATPAPGADEDAWLETAREIDSDLARERSASHLAAAGALRLLSGRPEAALDLLAAARAAAPDDARIRNDHAVALQRSGDPGDPLHALRVLDALLAPGAGADEPSLLHNTAVALTRAGLHEAAREAFVQALAAERDEGCRAALRQRRRALPAPAPGSWPEARRELAAAAESGDGPAVSRLVARWTLALRDEVEEEVLGAWGEAVLAGDAAAAARHRAVAQAYAAALAGRGDGVAAEALDRLSPELATAHRDYRDARRDQLAGAFERAEALATRAAGAFARAGSPFASLARRAAATCRYQAGDLRGALAAADAALATPDARRHPSLAGRWLWLQGLCQVGLGRPHEGLAAYQRAGEVFAALHDAEGVVLSETFAAETLNHLGQTADSARRLRRAWELSAPLAGRPRMQLVPSEIATLCLREDLLAAALAFQDVAVRATQASGLGYLEAYAVMERARIALRAGRRPQAEADLARARQILEATPPGALRERMAADLDLAEGAAALATDPALAAARLERGLAYFERAGRTFQPLGARTLLARAVLAGGDLDAAMESLRRGLSSRESLRAALRSESQRESFFDEAQGFFDDLVETAFRRGDVEAVFDAAERSRSRVLLDRAAADATVASVVADPEPLATLRARLPAGAALVELHLTRQSLYAICATRERAAALRLGAREEVEEELAALARRWRAGEDPVPPLAALHERLLRPCEPIAGAARALVVVPHGELARVPFAALHDARRGGFLVERATLVVAPSAAVALGVAGTHAGAAPPRTLSALVYADPEAGELAGRALPPLPGARAEAAAVARRYPGAAVRLGAAARRDRFLAEAGAHHVVHVATHGRDNARHPARSFLALAPAGPAEPGLLHAEDIAAADLSRTRLVVLAACEGASGGTGGSEGSLGVARAFLMAGVPAVVAALHEVDDRAGPPLFSEFHRRFAGGEPAAEALRGAQLALLRGAEPWLRSPVQWGSFQLVGRAPAAPGRRE